MRSVLAIHDLSSWGKSSLTVVLPVLETLGIETAVLPTAVLSTQTDGFEAVISHDLSGVLLPFHGKIRECGYSFSAVYSGYLASPAQVDSVLEIMRSEDGMRLVDPVFADSGEIYSTLGPEHVESLKALVAEADVITPNITEASILTGRKMRESYTNRELDDLVGDLVALGPKKGVVTGIPLMLGSVGNLAYCDGEARILSHDDLFTTYPGGGDAFASVFLGAMLDGMGFFSSAKLAGDVVFETMKEAKASGREHRLGIPLKPLLDRLGRAL